MPSAIFQFFYSTPERNLPYPKVPTRDVTGAQGHGNKTEPNLERMMENWCSCRQKSIRRAVIDALAAHAHADQHFLILTTRHPETGEALAVGVMPFSPTRFHEVRSSHPNRWKNHWPYVSDERAKVCSFCDAFRLQATKSRDGKSHVPGSRYALVHVPEGLLDQILSHFAQTKTKKREFLHNVRDLESRLQKADPEAFAAYSRANRLTGSGETCKSSIRARPKHCPG